MAPGLRQGCVCFPLLFNVFFPPMLLVALERFSEDADILADSVHLEEHPTDVGPQNGPGMCAASYLGDAGC